MKLFGIGIQLGKDIGLTNPHEESELIAKIDHWEKGALKEDATKLQKLYHKLHKDPIIEVFSPFIYIVIRQWFNGILHPELKEEEYRRESRY
ncbi:MAG: hypothetical protein ACJA1D_000189 [Polaribacter sp.]|jgi:hypothetical protein